MIAYMEGKILNIADESLLLLVGGVGYEVLLPLFVREKMKTRTTEETVALFIYYHQTERQPRPVLIGFETEREKAFFQLFISVDAIGPMKAVKAMDRSVPDIAAAIENRDAAFLASLKGIGKRTAQKIIATLHGRVGAFAGDRRPMAPGPDMDTDNASPLNGTADQMAAQVVDVLINQLGYAAPVARKMVATVMAEKPDMASPEQLFDAVIKRAGA